MRDVEKLQCEAASGGCASSEPGRYNLYCRAWASDDHHLLERHYVIESW